MVNLNHCTLCPRGCGADRTQGQGFCGGGPAAKIARAALHFWEEPCISGEEGSGTVFFSGCSLQCCFCQNYKISSGNFGKEVTPRQLGEIFLRLQGQGANNINLVTAGHYVPRVIEALDLVKSRLHIPVVYNTSSYEEVETLRMLEGYVDIYLPDLKYASAERAARYSGARDYVEKAHDAILEMYRQTGPAVFDEDGRMKKGMIVRHMVLPGGVEDAKEVLRWLKTNLPLDHVWVSVMSQYTPFYKSADYPEINRRLNQQEYDQVMDFLEELDIENGFVQELSSAKEEYTPSFCLEGIEDEAEQ